MDIFPTLTEIWELRKLKNTISLSTDLDTLDLAKLSIVMNLDGSGTLSC